MILHASASILGMTPNLPVSPFADRLAGACIIAQTDGQVLEVVKEPGFAQWVVYLLVFLIVADKVKGWAFPAKREVSGRIVTAEETAPATKHEVEKLREDFDSFIEQNRAEHQAAITAGQQRVVNLSEVMDKETGELEEALSDLRDSLGSKMDQAFATLTAKIEPLLAQGAASAAVIAQVDKRLTSLEERHTGEVSKLHSRIDDALRASLSGKQPK